MGINSVSLVGFVGQDPEVRYLDSGKVVANLTLAVNKRTRDDPPDWFNLEVWDKQAEFVANYVKKGSAIGITGRLKLDSWKDRNTEEMKSRPVISVISVEFVGRKDSQSNNTQNNNSYSQRPNNDEIPF